MSVLHMIKSLCSITTVGMVAQHWSAWLALLPVALPWLAGAFDTSWS